MGLDNHLGQEAGQHFVVVVAHNHQTAVRFAEAGQEAREVVSHTTAGQWVEAARRMTAMRVLEEHGRAVVIHTAGAADRDQAANHTTTHLAAEHRTLGVAIRMTVACHVVAAAGVANRKTAGLVAFRAVVAAALLAVVAAAAVVRPEARASLLDLPFHRGLEEEARLPASAHSDC